LCVKLTGQYQEIKEPDSDSAFKDREKTITIDCIVNILTKKNGLSDSDFILLSKFFDL